MARSRPFLLVGVFLTGILALTPPDARAGHSAHGWPITTLGTLAPSAEPRVAAVGASYIGQFSMTSTVTSTVPANGDVNPYGVAVVPRTTGKLVQGQVLVSNFNAKSNLQGTGTTIVQIAPGGTQSLFAQINATTLPGPCPGGVGLTTALAVLSSGWVIVGSTPTTNGQSATLKAGCLLVLDSTGRVREALAGPLINGPWDMAARDQGRVAILFVANVLNGTVAGKGAVVNKGTVIRIALLIPGGKMPIAQPPTVIGSGFSERTDPAALVIGPTGLGLGAGDVLYVADSLNNRIAAIPDAAVRTTTAFAGEDVTANGTINDPLGLAIAPNGDILTVNGNDGNIVETTPRGTQIDHKLLDASGSPPGAGCLFGLAIVPAGKGVYYVDDCTNTLNVLAKAPAAPMAQATIQNFAFNPNRLPVKAGTTVTWTNLDGVAHTVTADDGSFTSSPIAPSGTFSHTFAKPGSVTYHCAIHAFMAHASVMVTL
jgi:plastocyanin